MDEKPTPDSEPTPEAKDGQTPVRPAAPTSREVAARLAAAAARLSSAARITAGERTQKPAATATAKPLLSQSTKPTAAKKAATGVKTALQASGPKAAESAKSNEPRFVVESRTRLSRSFVWRVQRENYKDQGQKAWQGTERVPWYVTSNAFVAGAYARAVVGFLRDLVSPAAPMGPFDPNEPVHIVEFCAGSGHFSFLFLRKLTELVSALPALAQVKIRLVMTDLVEANIEAWQKSEKLRPFVERGLLDFARFDLENSKELELRVAGRTVSKGSLRNPVVAIANYAFDSVIQDAFRMKAGVLHESLLTVHSTRKEDATAPDAGTTKRLTTSWEHESVKLPYYGDPHLDALLMHYSDRLGDTSLLIPIGALAAIDAVASLADRRLFLISGDKAWAHEDELSAVGDPVLSAHNRVFSIMVNFNAIGGWCEAQGGFALHGPTRDPRLRVSIFALGAKAEAMPETTFAFREGVGSFGVYDYFSLATSLRPKEGFEPSLALLLGLLRLGEGDYNVVLTNSTLLTKHVKTAEPGQKRDLLAALERASEGFFPMDRDLPFELGRIYSSLERPIDALRCYQASLRLYGDHEATYLNAGLALYRLQQRKEALAMMEKALAIKPGYATARDWRNRIQSEMAQGS